MAQHDTCTNGSFDRLPPAWIARANRSLPVPLSPVISTVESTFTAMRATTLPALLLLLAACATTPPLPPGEQVGEEMQAQEVVRFSVVDANPPAYFDRVVLVEATVEAVCQSAGCWMKHWSFGEVSSDEPFILRVC